MLPVLGREVVEAEQGVAILDQALDRLVVFDTPGLDEGVEGGKRIRLGLGHPDFLQRPLGFRLLAVRQFVEDVGGFVHPAALAARLGPDLFHRLPESERAIGDRELGANRQPTPLQIEEQFPPRLRTFANAVDQTDKLLPALGCGSDDDQQALGVADEKRMRSQPSPPRSRTRGQRTATGPMPVMISRSGRCPWRTNRRRPSSVSLSAWQLSKLETSASTACARSARAPLRKTSVSGSVKVPGCESWKTLVSVTAYHSFAGEVEASNTPTIRRLTPSRRHQLSPIALRMRTRGRSGRQPALADGPRIMSTRSSATKSWIPSLLWGRGLEGYPRDGFLSLFHDPGYIGHKLFQLVLGGLKLRRLCVHFHLPIRHPPSGERARPHSI